MITVIIDTLSDMFVCSGAQLQPLNLSCVDQIVSQPLSFRNNHLNHSILLEVPKTVIYPGWLNNLNDDRSK